MFEFTKKNKGLTKAFLVLFVFMQVFSMLFFAVPAKAQITIVEDIPSKTKWGWEQIKSSLTTAALGSLLHASSYFMRKLAYDSATWIGSGGKGQGALAFNQGAGAYFEGLAKDTAADAIGELGKPFGLDLCSTPDLQFQVFLQIGLHSLYWDAGGGSGSGPQPSCNWQQLSNAWSAEAFESKYGPGGSKLLSQTFSNALRFEDSDFGIALGAKAKIDRNVASVIAGAAQDRTEGQGFKPVTELISGKVKSPAQVVKEESKVISSNQQGQMTTQQIAGVYGSGFLQVIPMAASVFLNTLVGEGLKTAQRELLSLFNKNDKGGSAIEALTYESSGFQNSRKKAEAVFSDLLTVSITQVNSYSQLEEFSSCPEFPVKPGLNNCVMDSGLRQALEESSLGEPITIAEALEKGYLNANWPIYSPDRTADNLDKGCYQKAFCYSNIQKLRRARIFPLGFEIAATLADPDKPEEKWTLGKVVEGFYDCAYESGHQGESGYEVEDLANHPYCHLIDPNWILKAPEARCNANVYAANLMDDNKTGIRNQECVDVQSCIKENDDGSCQFFGYCTREKNIWRFNADNCEEQYDTCTTFTSAEGVIDTYLARTLDYGECSIESVGCRAYSTEKNGDPAVTSTTWIASSNFANESTKVLGRNQTLYFNQNIENYTNNCSADTVGCTEFYPAIEALEEYENSYDDVVYLQKAPDYLGCYDIISYSVDCTQEKAVCSMGCSSLECQEECNSINCFEIDWPQTKIDLLALEDRPEACDEYASVCIPEEVGCDAYTPVASPDPIAIPGIIGTNFCDVSCSGYETFRQSRTAFEPEEFPLYFIPTEGDACNSTFSGCDEFTNIDEQSRGGEALEYYSDIKYCERPTGDNEKVFYSWEGSKAEGYVLKLHKLRIIDDDDFTYLGLLEFDFENETLEDVFPVESPAYASDSLLSLQSDYNYCNETVYNNLINNLPGDKALADCRALYNKAGEIYYRLLSDTISVSDECHPLRKTNSNLYVDNNITTTSTCSNKGGVWGDVPGDELEKNECQRCYAGGVYENGHCIYWAMTGADESNSCPVVANGCREYTGNTANNLEKVFSLYFDISGDDEDAINEAKAGWSPSSTIEISAESIQVGLQSLQVTGKKVSYGFDSTNFAVNDIFELTFWARGENQNLDVYFEYEQGDGQTKIDYLSFNKFSQEPVYLSVGTQWRQYHVGPATLSDIPAGELRLVFETIEDNNISYFLDNIQLTRVADKYYLIKDSWKKAYDSNFGDESIKDVPEICDETPDDPYPGQALGCRQYREESTGSTDIYATGFDTMCREEAIGCEAFYETNNNSNVNIVIYNLWCDDGVFGGTDKKCELIFDAGEEEGEEVIGSCIVQIGEKGCFVDGPINGDDDNYIEDVTEIENAEIVASTVIIPADSNDPVFLTDRDDFRCTEKSKGCMEVALEESKTPNIVDQQNKLYEFTETYILNNPDNYEDTLCRSDLVGCGEFTADNEKSFFKDPNIVGNSLCEYKDEVESNDSEITHSGWFLQDFGKCTDSENLCQTDDDCGEDVACEGVGTVPCYENYLQAGGKYGIWSNQSENYAGLVGICPESENGCREFIDPEDTSSIYPDGYPYYLLYNSRITSQIGKCEGKASLQEGCVLFNKTDEPNLLYDAGKTYDISEENNFEPTILQSNGSENDSNILLKVVRDRECAEWLACQGYVEVPDTQLQGAKRSVCYAVQACEAGTGLDCFSPIKDGEYEDKLLDIDLYLNRKISWQTGREFSGYSLFGQYPIADLEYINIKPDAEQTETFLAFVDKDYSCSEQSEGEACGSDFLGVCYQEECVYRTDGGSFSDVSRFYNDLSSQDCRGFPESDSPFVDDGTNSIVSEWYHGNPVYGNPGYANSNICQPGEDCSCEYLRVGFGKDGQVTEERFFDLDGIANIDGVDVKVNKLKIIQGTESGGYCGFDEKLCGSKTVLYQIKKSKRIGWRGYCLERDYSHHINGRTDNAPDAYACLTWMPVDYVPSEFDIYNSNTNIGYNPVDGGEYYCAEATALDEIGDNMNYSCNIIQNNTWYLDDADKHNNFCGTNADPYFISIAAMNSIYTDGGALSLSSNEKVDLSFKFDETKYQINNFLGKVNADILGPYEFVSRWDSSNGKKDNSSFSISVNDGDNPYGDNFDMLRSITFMERVINEIAYPCHPDSVGCVLGEPLGVLLPRSSGSNSFDEQTEYVEILATTGNSHDSGIIYHAPNKYESFLNKNFLTRVRWIPLLPEGGDTTFKENPGFGVWFDIDLSEETEYSFEDAEITSRWQKSTLNQDCQFCKLWVTKVQEDDNQEGYLLQWWQTDPKDDTNVYSNENSYAVNPLEVNNNGDPVVPCDSPDSDNWLAIEFLFDKETGSFTGYKSRFCEGTGKDHGIMSAVAWSMVPFCKKAVEVYDAEGESKAKTSVMWQRDLLINIGTQDDPIEYGYYLKREPYGSGLGGGDVLEEQGREYWFFGDPGGDNSDAGYPFACDHINTSILGECTTKEPGYASAYGIPKAEEVETDYIPTNKNWKEDRLDKLFAAVYSVFEMKEKVVGKGDFVWSEVDDEAYDDSFDIGRPPVIFYPGKEFKDDWEDYTNRFAINDVGIADNKLYGEGNLKANVSFYAWADHNQVPLRRIMIDWREKGFENNGKIFGEGQGYYTNAKPYCDVDYNYECYGDTNGDNIEEFSGLTCIKSSPLSCPDGFSCEEATLENSYGNQKEITCRDEAMGQSWNYTCDVTSQDESAYTNNATTLSGGLSNKPYVYSVGDIKDNKLGLSQVSAQKWSEILTSKGHKDNDLVCVFRPRVQVLDNWGWCTGSGGCEGEEKGGCYGDDLIPWCDSIYSEGWIEFNDIVVVAP